MIRLCQINKAYQQGQVEHHILKDVNLEIAKGEFVAIMGPSGSGKTTLLNMIGLLDRPTSGQYFFGSDDVARLSDHELSRLRNKKLGFIFQNYNLIGSKNALENVILPLKYAKVSKKEAVVRGTELLTIVGLADHLQHYPDEMSGGQQQRVAIARALINTPDLILADEPTGNLDSETGESIMNLLLNLHKDGQTILMVTHDASVAKHADRTEHMADGRLTPERKVLKEA